MAIANKTKQTMLDHLMETGATETLPGTQINIAFHFANASTSTDPLTGGNSTNFDASHAASGASNDQFSNVSFNSATDASTSVSTNNGALSVSNVQSNISGASHLTWITLHKATNGTATYANAFLSIQVSTSGTPVTFGDGDTVSIADDALTVQVS